ncbi:hypothetical protein HSBAA_65230 [Vreelandella sulfidaeris]|uniref:Uncharacterized protein n=1 Tax=Vreelandella sulfidaeris TaxID=115553 RepID=A0A455UHL0_9GAMM|nr:hypothetical protein HSBAA_65230 [Halomonas sulfidaeris]
MSQRSYDSLPADLQQVIDDHSGLEWSLRAAEVYDEMIRQGREEAVEAGHEIVVIEDALEDPEWGPVLQQTIDDYLEDIGGSANDIYKAAMDLQQSCVA